MRWTWEKFGIHIQPEAPQPVVVQRLPNTILKSLRLAGVSGIQVKFYESIGKAIVIVQAQHVNPTWQQVIDAGRKSGWDVEVVAATQFERLKRLAVKDFNELVGIPSDLAQTLVEHGYFTVEDLSMIEPEVLMRIGKLDMPLADAIIEQAKREAEQQEI